MVRMPVWCPFERVAASTTLLALRASPRIGVLPCTTVCACCHLCGLLLLAAITRDARGVVLERPVSWLAGIAFCLPMRPSGGEAFGAERANDTLVMPSMATWIAMMAGWVTLSCCILAWCAIATGHVPGDVADSVQLRCVPLGTVHAVCRVTCGGGVCAIASAPIGPPISAWIVCAHRTQRTVCTMVAILGR